MALIPGTRYPAQTDVAAGYPQGKARNAGASQDGTGTPLEKDWVNDQFGFQQALLDAAGITPSGSPDAVGASQYLDAIRLVSEEAASKGAERLMLATWVDGGEIVASEFRTIAWAAAWGVFLVTSGMANMFKSPDGVVWTAAGSVLAARGIVVNPSGIGMAVGDAGLMTRSVDGTTWATQTSGTSNELRGVVWTGSLFVAVGAVGTIITSPTGVTWTTRTSGLATQLNAVASSGSLTVAVGDAGKIVTSPTGTTWTTRTSGIATDLYAVAWNGALFIAVGASGKIVTSPDGITWTLRTTGVATSLLAVAATDNYIIAMGLSGVLLFSSTGVVWQPILNASDGGTFAASGVAWSGLACVACGSQPSHGKISRSLPRLP
jgi:hypothetical protein